MLILRNGFIHLAFGGQGIRQREGGELTDGTRSYGEVPQGLNALGRVEFEPAQSRIVAAHETLRSVAGGFVKGGGGFGVLGFSSG